MLVVAVVAVVVVVVVAVLGWFCCLIKQKYILLLQITETNNDICLIDISVIDLVRERQQWVERIQKMRMFLK